MSTQHTPGPSTGTARLWPVCPASNVHSCNYGQVANKDADNRLPCPVCGKVVKLRKSGSEAWANMIPFHHAEPIGSIDTEAKHRAAIAKATGSAS